MANEAPFSRPQGYVMALWMLACNRACDIRVNDIGIGRSQSSRNHNASSRRTPDAARSAENVQRTAPKGWAKRITQRLLHRHQDAGPRRSPGRRAEVIQY